MYVRSSIFVWKNVWEARKFSNVTSSFLAIQSAAAKLNWKLFASDGHIYFT